MNPRHRRALDLVLQTLFGALWPKEMAENRRRRNSPRGIVVTALLKTAGAYTGSKRSAELRTRGPAGPEVAERVRSSVARTAAEGTAAIRVHGWISGTGPGWPLPGPDGRIDFGQHRCLYAEDDDQWTLMAPGLELYGRPGAWEDVSDSHEPEDNPFWLLEQIEVAAEASDEGIESAGDADRRRYVVKGDSRIEVWLDGEGRIRRARLHRELKCLSLELLHFGGPEPIELPPPDEIEAG